MERGGCVYILTNFENTVLYIGVTSKLFFRTKEHRVKFYEKSLNLTGMIYFSKLISIKLTLK